MFVLAHVVDYLIFAPVLVVLTFILGKSVLESHRDGAHRDGPDA